MIYVVIRRCCLGPNCAYNHGASTSKLDKRLWVCQFLTSCKTMAERVAKNWEEYDADIAPFSEKLEARVPAHVWEWIVQSISRKSYHHAKNKSNDKAAI